MSTKPTVSRFNQKMTYAERIMKSLGWSEGKGLGKREDGIKECVKPKMKFNTKGIGFTGIDHQWVTHQEHFNDLLLKLTKADGTGLSHEIPRPASDSKLYGRTKFYSKMLRGKDLSNRDSKDIEAIILSSRQPLAEEIEAPVLPSESNSTIKVSKISTVEYFSQRFDEKRQAASKTLASNARLNIGSDASEPSKLEKNSHSHEMPLHSFDYRQCGFDANKDFLVTSNCALHNLEASLGTSCQNRFKDSSSDIVEVMLKRKAEVCEANLEISEQRLCRKRTFTTSQNITVKSAGKRSENVVDSTNLDGFLTFERRKSQAEAGWDNHSTVKQQYKKPKQDQKYSKGAADTLAGLACNSPKFNYISDSDSVNSENRFFSGNAANSDRLSSSHNTEAHHGYSAELRVKRARSVLKKSIDKGILTKQDETRLPMTCQLKETQHCKSEPSRNFIDRETRHNVLGNNWPDDWTRLNIPLGLLRGIRGDGLKPSQAKPIFDLTDSQIQEVYNLWASQAYEEFMKRIYSGALPRWIGLEKAYVDKKIKGCGKMIDLGQVRDSLHKWPGANVHEIWGYTSIAYVKV